MGDTVSKEEWQRRRKSLDSDIDASTKRLKSGSSHKEIDDAVQHLDFDRGYKKTYSKELGYDDKTVVGKKIAPKKARGKAQIVAKKTARKKD